MESSSRASSSVERTSPKFADLRFANVMGTVIALLTLTVPLVAIGYFSSPPQPSWRTPAQLIPNVRR
nr:MAG: hypothetical protein EDM05_04290 [Leptolyngbya sp. IPPAS B-1204]